MSVIFAPARLPIAPRPVPSELFSSWMLRVASSNCISICELEDAVASRSREDFALQSLDHCLPLSFLRALSRFCRVPVAKLQAMDLRQRLPHLEASLLLRFPRNDLFSSERKLKRVGYAFCPICIANQDVIHVRWEWCFACVIRCGIHRTPLQLGCPACGESDPLSFDWPDQKPVRNCWACGAPLADPAQNCSAVRQSEQLIRSIEDAYKAALLGVAPHPSLVGKATDRAFRRFVEDMLQLTIRFPRLDSDAQRKEDNRAAGARSREIPFAIIADLISNAAPSWDSVERQSRYRRSLRIWAELFTRIDEAHASVIEKSSRHWPVAVQRRFAAALRIRTQKRWPHNRFPPITVCPGFKCSEVIVVRDLTTAKPFLF